MCLQRILEEGFEPEDVDSFGRPNESTSFKLAFLTLIKNDIILEYDEE